MPHARVDSKAVPSDTARIQVNLKRFLSIFCLTGASIVFGLQVGTFLRTLRLHQAPIRDESVAFTPHVHVQQYEPLAMQIQHQRTIQNLIHTTQYPTNNCQASQRILLRDAMPKTKDGFALELQYMARLLQSALAARRTLVLTHEFRSAYEPEQCPTQGWTCLWKALGNCTAHWNLTTTSASGDTVVDWHPDDLEFPLSTGIGMHRDKSPYFNVQHYGPKRILQAPPSFPPRKPGSQLMLDILSHWERAYGRFWIRAQVAHYLWTPNTELQGEIRARLPPFLRNKKQPTRFIGFHIRLTDNIPDLERWFARNASATRTLHRYMELAQRIRSREDPSLCTIYLATDNAQVLRESQEWKRDDWTFVVQDQVDRSTATDFLWFGEGRSAAAGAIATDMEVLRRADYLVGSSQSNVYRMATVLNTAWHVERYSVRQGRHWMVDVEWFENP